MPRNVWDEITDPFPNFKGCTDEVWELISNSNPRLIMDVLAYPCWEWNESFLIKGPQIVTHRDYWGIPTSKHVLTILVAVVVRLGTASSVKNSFLAIWRQRVLNFKFRFIITFLVCISDRKARITLECNCCRDTRQIPGWGRVVSPHLYAKFLLWKPIGFRRYPL